MKRTNFTKSLSFFLALVLTVSCISYYGMKSQAAVLNETTCTICGGKLLYEGPILGTAPTPIDCSLRGGYIFSNTNMSLAEWHYYLFKCENFSAQDRNHDYYPYSGQHGYTNKYEQIDSQSHKVTSTCTRNTVATNVVGTVGCGYSKTEIQNHSVMINQTVSVSSTQHKNVKICACGYVMSEVFGDHSFTYSEAQSLNNGTHRKNRTCACRYSDSVVLPCKDTNGDDRCDECNYLIPRFSVTVPTTMYLSLAKDGKVYHSDNCAIDNLSTAEVTVKRAEIHSLNGWQIVPFSTKMAREKVDSKKIGFMMKGKSTQSTGSFETFDFGSSWNIPKGSSSNISYDAVVSAVSSPVNENVLNVVFIVEWRA